MHLFSVFHSHSQLKTYLFTDHSNRRLLCLSLGLTTVFWPLPVLLRLFLFFFSFLLLFFQFIVQCCRSNWPCHGTQFLSAHYCTGLSYCIKSAAVRLVMPTHGHGWGEQQSWFSSHKGRIPRHRQRAREEIARVRRKDVGVSGESVSVSWNAVYTTRGRVMKAQKTATKIQIYFQQKRKCKTNKTATRVSRSATASVSVLYMAGDEPKITIYGENW